MNKVEKVFNKLAKQQTAFETMSEHGKNLAILGAKIGAGLGVTKGIIGKLSGVPFRAALPLVGIDAIKGTIIGGGTGVALGGLGVLLENNRKKNSGN